MRNQIKMGKTIKNSFDPPITMIIRVWRCTISRGKEKKFLSFLNEHAGPILRTQKGCVCWFFGKDGSRDDGKRRCFVIVTVWDDLVSLKRFTGSKWKMARIDKEEKSLLGGMPKLEHFESILTSF